MTWYDWIIFLLPVCLVMGVGVHCRRYIRGVSDFLAAGRLCGRYVICVGDGAAALSIMGLVTYVEMHYRTGFSVAFWSSVLPPLVTMLGLLGYCTYRFRETRAMSLGQFLEMRYNRRFRVFASGLRAISEMLANMVIPAISARFFMRLLELPETWNFFGLGISTYVSLMVVFLALAITLICCGGTLALVVTDTIQGMILDPILVCFVVFLFWKFSVSGEIMPTMMDRAPGESFLNPYDIGRLRDFNVFAMVVVAGYGFVVNRANWFGTGTSTAAKTPHEQKMAGVLSSWRNSTITIFYILVSCALVTFLGHERFAAEAGVVRRDLAARIADEVLRGDDGARDAVKAAVAAVPPQIHRIGVDPPPSQENNLDTAFLDVVHEALLDNAKVSSGGSGGEPPSSPGADGAAIDAEGRANDSFQQFRTLFGQLSLSATMRHLLPPGLFGLFALLCMLAMLSTDDSRIYSAALTIAQDVVLPLRKRPFTPRGHIRMIRAVSVGIGFFFLAGSTFMRQLDYIHMFLTIAVAGWMSGAGPVMVFGLYSRFGTVAGAWASLAASVSGTTLFVLVQRNWADVVYPAIAKAGLVERLDRILRALSSPFGTWIEWKMDAVKCPVNSVEFSFLLSLFCMLLYIVVSKLTCRKPFNLAKMLHREPLEAEPPLRQRRHFFQASPAAVKRTLGKLAGITPEYTVGDRIMAWGVFLHGFVFSFVFCFVAVVAWNAVHRWPARWWGRYFVLVNFIVPGAMAAVSTFWFGIGGILGLRRLFRDLAARREVDDRDNGTVEQEHVQP